MSDTTTALAAALGAVTTVSALIVWRRVKSSQHRAQSTEDSQAPETSPGLAEPDVPTRTEKSFVSDDDESRAPNLRLRGSSSTTPPAPAPQSMPTSAPPTSAPAHMVAAPAQPTPASADHGVATELVAPPHDVPAPPRGRMRALVERLGRSNAVFGGALMTLLSDEHADTDWESVEDTLIMADFGVGPAHALVSQLRSAAPRRTNTESMRAIVREELLRCVNTSASRHLNLQPPGAASAPQVVMVVGVNGTGKTTTTGKIARMLVADGYRVHLAAADTFRAAAAEQLQTWAERVGVSLTRKDAGSDPAAVAFDGLSEATAASADVLLVDTAGRLHTKAGLMDELGKVLRVLQRERPVSEVLLVLDATTGQNGLNQARVFAEVVDVSGVVLTKLDGTAKGGIVVAVQQELKLPVKLVGLGEGPDDLAEFEPETFVDALLA